MKVMRLMGTNIYLNPFFLGVLALFFVAGVLINGLIAFAIVLIHELAHVAAARRYGVKVDEVELLPFGGVARMGYELPMNPYKEAKIAIAGPACNFLLVFVAIAFKNHGLWHNDLGPFFIQCNLLIAFFNLLPALPLDGGRVYRAYLATKTGLSDATRVAASWGQKWAVAIFLLGCLGIYLGATGIDISLVAIFLLYAATREKNMAPFFFIRHLVKKKEELVRGGILPARVLTVMENLTLSKITRSFVPQQYHLIVVVDSHGQVKAEVTESEIIDKLIEGAVDMPVGELKK